MCQPVCLSQHRAVQCMSFDSNIVACFLDWRKKTRKNMNNIKTPVNVQALPKIETQFNISNNLYGHSDSNIYTPFKPHNQLKRAWTYLLLQILIQIITSVLRTLTGYDITSLDMRQKNSSANIVSNIPLMNIIYTTKT